MNIDWKKYKRFFSFGCSFTSYRWPSWADVVHQEMPDVEFYNLGQAGAGNLMISARITEANQRFKFTDTDLVMVMYTTSSREDRWVDGSWLTCGNIYNQKYYSDEWVSKFADERGYLIRDLALLEMSSSYIKSLPCDSYVMVASPLCLYSETDYKRSAAPDDLTELYKDLISKLPESLYTLEMQLNWTPEYTKFTDGHPSTMRYYNYLNKLGFNLSEKTRLYAKEQTAKLCEITHVDQLSVVFAEQDSNITRARDLMF